MAESDAQRTKQRAILCVLGASAAFTVAAALVKAVAPAIPTVEIMLFRSVFAFAVLFPLVRRHGLVESLRTRQPWGHAMRALTGFAGMFGSFYGFAHMPLATVTALGFAMPIFLSILSVPLLGERVSAARALSIGAGLLGVLVVLRPWEDADPVAALPALVVVFGVAAWALAMVSIRRMGQAGERNVTIVLWFSLATAAIAGLLSVPVWVTPNGFGWAALIAVGLISGAAQLLMTEGYRSGEATMLAPFEYGAIIYTVLLGWAIWGEVPGPWETVGILFLVVAGLITWWRERASRPLPLSRPPGLAVPSPPLSAGRLRSRPARARTPD